ncbi:unnamed protein product [Lathyrus sativus]|nr:unnamed protein product [Lathyrus sativus]
MSAIVCWLVGVYATGFRKSCWQVCRKNKVMAVCRLYRGSSRFLVCFGSCTTLLWKRWGHADVVHLR